MTLSPDPLPLSRRRLLAVSAALSLSAALPPSRSAAAASAPSPLSERDPAALGLLADRLTVAETLVADAVARQGVPGAVLLVGRRGAVALRKVYGHAVLRPAPVPMTVNTIFDLASLTKPVATATSVMQLVEQGRVELDAPVARYLPPFERAGGDRARITVRHLLTHAGGLPAGGGYAGKTRTLRTRSRPRRGASVMGLS